MRRFIAYVLASLTIFLGIGVAFKPVATRINADLSFRNGNTIHFKLEEREEGGKLFTEVDNAAKYYADIMTSRLEAYGIADYKITTEGDKNLSVTLTCENETEVENIGKLLAANPELEVANLPGNSSGDKSKKQAEERHIIDEDNVSWHSKEAYLTYDGTTSIVVMPIPDKFLTKVNEMIEQAKIYEEKSKSTNDEPKKTPNSIILWMNRFSSDVYKEGDKYIERKIIYSQFNSENFYYGSNNNAFQIKFTPSSNNVSDITASYKRAYYVMKLLNSTETDFDCIVTKTVPATATVENLLIYGDHVHIAMSSTFIALMISFILIVLLLSLFYRLGAVAIVSSSSLTTFLSFTLFVFFKPLFNIAALIGVISVFALSIFIGVLYNHYLHEEVYKGRSLKKANYEASKKTTLLTVDISVVSMILGIAMYFVGGSSVASLGVILICSAIFNLLINTFVLKGLMMLITNNTSTQKQYKLFAIDEKKVPDLMRGEKPSYLGPYQNKDFTKKKKLSALIIGGVTAISCIGMIVFSSTKLGIFNSKQYYEERNTFHLVVEGGEFEPTTTDEIKNNYLPKIKHNGKALNIKSDIDTYDYTYYYREASSEETKDKHYYVYDVTIYDNNVNKEEFTCEGLSGNQDLSSCLQYVFKDLTALDLGESLFVSKVNTLNGNPGLIFGASAIAIITTSLYFWIRRYRLSRVIPMASIALASNVIALGAISLSRIPATPLLAISIGLTSVYTILGSLILMHKEKDILRDERLKSIETRRAALDKALRIGALPLINFAVLAAFITLSYLAIANKTFSAVYFSSTLGIVVATIMLLTIYTSFANLLDKKISNIQLPEVKIKKKKKVINKSNEPEEAIFIGIND